MRKPYFKKSHKRWYVHMDGRDVPLGADEKIAFKRWAAMIESQRKLGDAEMKVFVLADAFLKEQKGLTSEGRLELLTRYIAAFCVKFGNELCSDITKGETVRWADGVETWGDWARYDALRSVKQMFSWAVEMDYMPKNPLRSMKLSVPASRQRTLTYEEHAKLVKLSRELEVNGKAFALYLIASRCGARPQTIRSVTAADVVGSTWVMQEHKTRKKTGKPLVVYLPPCLETIVNMLKKKYPEGPLFRKDNGEPWSNETTGWTFRQLREKAGISKDAVLYSYRHGYATDLLHAGNSELVVAKIMGHTSAAMLRRTYAHVENNQQFMLDAASSAFRK